MFEIAISLIYVLTVWRTSICLAFIVKVVSLIFFLLLSIHMLAIAISDSATGFFLYFLFLVFAGLGSWLELVREP
jgi:hypothetical protein